MLTVSLRDARQRLGELVNAAARGEEVVITRRGRQAAQLRAVPRRPRRRLPDLSAFRASLRLKGSLTDTLLTLRNDERA